MSTWLARGLSHLSPQHCTLAECGKPLWGNSSSITAKNSKSVTYSKWCVPLHILSSYWVVSGCRRCVAVGFRQRPYFVEYTRSHPNSEVKRRKARSVLGWGTAREALRVLLAFLIPLQSIKQTFFWFSTMCGCWLSPTAILRRTYPIPSELGSQAAKGPVSTGVGDRPGSPQGAVGFL